MPGTCGTAGGLTINENAQVVNVNGEPIEHLYAVGNCSSGVSGGTYVHGGISLGSGAVMSWGGREPRPGRQGLSQLLLAADPSLLLPAPYPSLWRLRFGEAASFINGRKAL